MNSKTIALIGLGYVGLPLAVEFAKKRQVIGFDIEKKRIKELNRKVAIARRGRNPEMLFNLQQALNTYRDAIRQRRVEEWHKNNKKLRNEPDLGDLVNID